MTTDDFRLPFYIFLSSHGCSFQKLNIFFVKYKKNMSAGYMFNKIDCGCVYQTFRDRYGVYDKDDISRFIRCKLCAKNEKILTDDQVASIENENIDFLKKQLQEDENQAGEQWFSAAANSSLCFMK